MNELTKPLNTINAEHQKVINAAADFNKVTIVIKKE